MTNTTFALADVCNKVVTVYTTAQNTDYRLTKTVMLPFKDFGQPLETQVCVFIDPSKMFQTIVGIGGAITDVATETFAKLPSDKQQELMGAYYDEKNGIGYHGYETWTGSAMQFDNLKKVKEAFPFTNLIFTEGCIEKFDFNRIDDWSLGEHYGHSMVNDFNAGTIAWLDWNVLLDETGGSNHVGNFCFAPIIADTRNGKLYYTNIYYYLGHFSKFVKPGAKRIISSFNLDILQTTAFINPDGTTVVIVLNTTDKETNYILWLNGSAVEIRNLPHSITILIQSYLKPCQKSFTSNTKPKLKKQFCRKPRKNLTA